MDRLLDWTSLTPNMPADGWNVLELAVVFCFLFLLGRIWFSRPAGGDWPAFPKERPSKKTEAGLPWADGAPTMGTGGLLDRTPSRKKDGPWPSANPEPAPGLTPSRPLFLWAGETSRP